MSLQQTTQQTTPTFHDEDILVVKRSLLFGAHSWHGLTQDGLDAMIEKISAHQEFLPRSLMEQDPLYKQIIPYLVFCHDNRYFVMQRQTKASETRLASKFTLGIGGHIRKEDMTSSSLIDWAQREFEEEVSYTGNITWKPLGMVNDDTNPVGQVHVGLVFLAQGDSDAISVKSELKSGVLLPLPEIKSHYYENMETWSQFIVDQLP